jgi:hypothetical protein
MGMEADNGGEGEHQETRRGDGFLMILRVEMIFMPECKKNR